MIGLLSIIAFGFFLGMRHTTDADHVIAVSTIVSRYRSVQQAVSIGALWGVGCNRQRVSTPIFLD
jgi:high-affinity nickel permease